MEKVSRFTLISCMNGWEDDESAIAACGRRSPPV